MKDIEVLSAKQTIVLSSAFEKRARRFGSPEYKKLQAVRCDNPGYQEVIRKFKKNTKQEHFDGLTYDFMRWYIVKVESKDDAPAVLEGLDYLINISKCHSAGKRYQTVKAWFLKRYPDVKAFGADNEHLTVWRELHKKEESEHKPLSDREQSNNITDLAATGTEG